MRGFGADITPLAATKAVISLMLVAGASVCLYASPANALDLDPVATIDKTLDNVLSSSTQTSLKKNGSGESDKNSSNSGKGNSTDTSQVSTKQERTERSQSDAAEQAAIKKAKPLPLLKQIDVSKELSAVHTSEFTPTLVSQGYLAPVPEPAPTFLQPSSQGWKLFDVAWYWWIIGVVAALGAVKTVSVLRQTDTETALVS